MTNHIQFIGAKGGVGASTIAATTGLLYAAAGQRTLLLDHSKYGDLSAILGLSNTDRLREVVNNLDLAPVDPISIVNYSSYDYVLHDAGLDRVSLAATTVLVSTTCYLAARRVVSKDMSADRLVCMAGNGRALTPADIERATGVPLAATVLEDPLVARCIDAGILTSRIPRQLREQLAPLVSMNVSAE